MTRQSDNEPELSPVKQALLEIRELRVRLERSESRATEPIAIVGIGCRFPGGGLGPDAYWRLLEQGVDAIEEMPRSRWDVDGFYDPNPDAPGKMSTRWGGFLHDIDQFDPEFFGISAREAATIDPQQRLLLEVSWEALEHAGIPPHSLLGSQTGVFTGISSFDYPQLELQIQDPTSIDAYFATGAAHSVASGRISYLLGVRGPCVSLDTACSASLVAVHLACQSLRQTECDLALAGGVSVLLLPEMYVDFSRARMMAADGRCKTFDAAADGYVRSEGCGVVVLKRLSDALTQGDDVLAVIRGSAVNHDGRSSGLTAPNGPSQVAVIRRALAQAGVAPERVGYVETHGTGTSLGDPIEVQALADAFGVSRRTRPLLVGSAKSNIGNLECAAGVAGLIKAVLCMRQRAVPKSLHFDTPNPRIPWDRIPIEVVRELTPWPADGGLPVAGVSAFGFSGTNAHVIVEAAPERESVAVTLPPDRPMHVLTVSAQTGAALREMCGRFADALEKVPAALADFAFSVNAGKSHYAHRLAVMAKTGSEAAAQLRASASGAVLASVASGTLLEAAPAQVCFMFAGQGSQYPSMAQALFDSEPRFRAALTRCDDALASTLGRRVSAILFGDDSESLLSQPRFAQPAIVAVEYALSELWRSWGVTPAAAIGHSLGEYAAAIATGVLTVEDGLALIAERARLIEERCPVGQMAAIRAGVAAVEQLASRNGVSVSIAAINGPHSVTVSGEPGDVETLVDRCRRDGLSAHPLETNRAFHSPMLKPALREYAEFAARIPNRAPTVPLISNLSGDFFRGATGPSPSYWVEQARRPVQFQKGIEAAARRGNEVFLEVSPTATLVGLAAECLAGGAGQRRFLPSLRRGRGEWEQLLETLSSLYVRGVDVDWGAFDAPHGRRRVVTPTYPFQRKRYWYRDDVSASPKGPVSDDDHALSTSAWQRALSAGQRQASRAPLELDLGSYSQRWAALEALSNAYVIRALLQLGLYHKPGERHTVADVVRSAGVLPMYQSLLERWLDRLAASGFLQRARDAFVALQPLTAPAIDTSHSRALALFADSPYVVEYVGRCGDVLAGVITGKASALETLFPRGSRETAIDIYRHWPLSRYCNDIVGAVAAAIALQVPAHRPIRMLEIGAGTGGTTAAILPVLPPDRTIYCYTDVSEFFFAAARDDFGEYPFVRYGVLDIEQSPESQGYGRHMMDLVVAANVLHATRDLHRTVDHVLSLLRPGGVLVLYEVTDPKAWIDTSVALIAGWAKSADGLRDNGPLLSAGSWRRLLLDRGFVEVATLPDPSSAAAVLGTSVIVARAPAAHVAPAVMREPRADSIAVGAAAPHETAELVRRIREALPDERLDLLVDFVRAQVGVVLRRDAEEVIGRHHNLMDIGVDSLMAIEFRDRLTRELDLSDQLSATLIFDYPNVEAVARYLARLLGLDLEQRAAAASPATADEQRALALEALSDEETEAMLLKRLEDV